MSSFGANNMPPSATAGAYTGGMPHYPNANINLAPTYTSPASYGPTSGYPYPMEYAPMHYHHHHHKHAPVYTAAAAYGGLGTSTGIILVLFILLVIISRACL